MSLGLGFTFVKIKLMQRASKLIIPPTPLPLLAVIWSQELTVRPLYTACTPATSVPPQTYHILVCFPIQENGGNLTDLHG